MTLLEPGTKAAGPGRPLLANHAMWPVGPSPAAIARSGAGRPELSACDLERYATLDGYATDVLEICDHLDLDDVIYVGHSVAAMIRGPRRQP